MTDMENMTFLFDMDGVIIDSETQYTVFWDRIGEEILGRRGFGASIKGQTLTEIMDGNFPDDKGLKEEIIAALYRFEADMDYDYIPGAREFLTEVKEAGLPSAIVTSSNAAKMANVLRHHPELPSLVDLVLTSEHFSRSKPDPECFIKGIDMLGGRSRETVVFEDSFYGIEAGRAAGACIVGLATTNSREAIAPLCDIVTDDFIGFDIRDILNISTHTKLK